MRIDITEKPKAVIFDMDGTLIDSMWIWPDIDAYYVKKYHLELPDNFHRAIEGKSYHETAQYFRETFDMALSTEEIMNEWTSLAYQRYTEEVTLKPGVKEFLQYGKENGILFGIATSNGRTLAEAALKALQIDSYFTAMRTSGEVSEGKPSPDIYLKVAEDMQVLPEHCLVFEDVPMGILAGKRAGMQVCAVYDEFSRPLNQEKKKLADYYIHDFHDVMDRIKERNTDGK